MEKIYELLGMDKLNEDSQKELKKNLDMIIETKVSEQVTERLDEEKEKLNEFYEEKFDEYKDEITEKFSDFVDDVIEEEIKLPDYVKEFARKGELYEDVIETLKSKIAIDEATVNDETIEILQEAKSDIEDLREKVDSLMESNMEYKKDAKDMALALYIMESLEGLTSRERKKVLSVIENMDIRDKNDADEKIEFVIETILENKDYDEDEDEDEYEDEDEDEMNEGTTYKEFFENMLDKYDVDEPDELDDKTRKKFWDEIDREWKSKKEKKKMNEWREGKVDGKRLTESVMDRYIKTLKNGI